MAYRTLFPTVLLLMTLTLTLTHVARADAPGGAPATRAPATSRASDVTSDVRFLRFIGDARNGGSLETSDVTYRNPAGVEVRLVAAVHIGEESYFQRLNDAFKPADAVLYEMIKPKGAPPPAPGAPPGDHAIAQLQQFLKTRLNLTFQLDVIDYRPANFVHADMDAETFFAMQEKRGESFASIILASMLEAFTNPTAAAALNDPEQPQTMLDLLARPDGERQIKLLIARQLGDIEASAMGLKGLNGTVILTERNKAVILALKDALANRRKRIAIFYGAAHMPDLSKQIEEMGFKPVSTAWYEAWDVRIRPNEPSAFQRIQQRVKEAQQAAPR